MRYPAVAGRFYSSKEKALREEIEECFRSRIGPGEIPALKPGRGSIVGAVVPHAGYMFSGPVTAHVFGAMAEDGFPETFVVIGPNHHGVGAGVAMTAEDFVTPLGKIEADRELAKKLKGWVDEDPSAHRHEHSIEVQVPFIQYFSKKAKLLPISMAFQDFETAKELGARLKKACEGRDVIVLASSDFSHYVPAAFAEKQDRAVIDRILALDPQGVEATVTSKGVSMCGYGPVMAMLEAVGGKTAKLLKYATSGDVHPMSEVVGYAGIVVRR
ncbi:MAG: AmmeMemoRadiSam system protein B [Methanomassiliicoccales archaeon]|nr:AmmeMemoRadiSam system protein B [Methanomassiliicoccales archaeon]MDD1756023.1 AmmeMemoRadiSam system protein B [Methanomassiliicoccales archaeon]